MIGAFLGWKAVILTILLGSLIGSIIGVIVMMLKGKDLKYAIPFGPFFLSGRFCLFYGERLSLGTWTLTSDDKGVKPSLWEINPGCLRN